MKIRKYIAMMLLTCMVGYTFTACKDDEALGEAPRIFRPVATLEVQQNKIVVDWENIKEATSYELELYRVIGTDEVTGESIYEETPVKTGTCTSAPYTFDDLSWDEKYIVKIKGVNDNKSSEYYQTKEVSVTYISKITGVKLIDNAARVSWDEGGAVIKAIKVVEEPVEDVVAPVDANEWSVPVSDEEYTQGYVDIKSLTPEMRYTFYAYSDASNMNNDTYAGRASGTTPASANYDDDFGVGNWIDLRSYSEEEAADILNSDDLKAQLKDNMGLILSPGVDYYVEGFKFNKSLTLMTGPTLGNNARLIIKSAFQCEKGMTVEKIEFRNLDMYSKYAVPGGGYELNDPEMHNKGFGGMQVFNEKGTNSTVGSLIFSGCHLEGYRSIVRAQSDNDNFTKILFDGCSINGVGDQGVITTTNTKADWREVSFKDCTITNVVEFCDFRSIANDLTLNIENCTFCYAPIETSKYNSLPLFRIENNTAVTLNVTNTLFGPAMATVGQDGSNICPNVAGTIGSFFLNAPSPANVVNSFKTNFEWIVDANGKTYPMEGLQALDAAETEIWNNPSAGDFKIISSKVPAGVGASKWLQ